MTMKRLIIAVTACFMGATQAQAQVNGEYRSKQSGKWGSTSTWEVFDRVAGTWGNASAAPQGTDIVSIQHNHSVAVNITSSVNTLLIREVNIPFQGPQSGIIQMAADLTIEKALLNDGTIEFASNKVVTKLIAADDIFLSGTISVTGSAGGIIESKDPGDVIAITNGATIVASGGDLTFDAELQMDGTISANTSGRTIAIEGKGPLDGSSGTWEVALGTLRFNTNASSNVSSSGGVILVTGGTLDIDETLQFAGGFKQTGGTIDVASGKELIITGRYHE